VWWWAIQGRPINPKRKKERKMDEVVNFGCNPKSIGGGTINITTPNG